MPSSSLSTHAQAPQSPVPHTLSGRHCVVVRLSALGDVALTTGVLQHWGESLGLTFTVITKAAFAPLFENHPAVRHVIAVQSKDLHGSRQRALFQQLAAQFQGETLLDLHGTLRSRLLGLLWQGPVRRYPKRALTRRLFLLSHGKLGRQTLLQSNVAQRYWHTLVDSARPAHAGVPSPNTLCPQFFLTEAEHQQAIVMLTPLTYRAHTQSFATPLPLLALHPFATHASKTWDMPLWLELAERLDCQGIPFFWVGQEATAHPLPGMSFVNNTSLRELLALLAQADLLITGDSGPMHLAEGVGTPVVALFGPTCREWGFFPSSQHSLVLQAPLHCRPCSLHGKTANTCSHACIKALTPADVVASTLCHWSMLTQNAEREAPGSPFQQCKALLSQT